MPDPAAIRPRERLPRTVEAFDRACDWIDAHNAASLAWHREQFAAYPECAHQLDELAAAFERNRGRDVQALFRVYLEEAQTDAASRPATPDRS